MTAWWMAQLTLIGTLLAVAAFGAERALTALRRPTRWVWVAALTGTVLLGGLAAERATRSTAPSATPALLPTPVTAVSAAPAATLWARMDALWTRATSAAHDTLGATWQQWQGTLPAHIDAWLRLAWIGASTLVLSGVIAVHWRYRRRRAAWPLRAMQDTTVRVADTIGPAVIGLTRAEIVVPQWLFDRDPAEQALVIAHEREHLRQHDPLLLALAQLLVILLPWHPAVWWMAARLRLAVELDCDHRVLRRGISTREYGMLLIDLADHRTGFGSTVPAFSCSPSHLERRLRAMTPRRLRYPVLRALATGAVASLAVLAACESNLPTSQAVEQMTAQSAVQAAGRVALLDTAQVTYYIDEKPVTPDAANQLPAERIASVRIARQGANRRATVKIASRDIFVAELLPDSAPAASIRLADTDGATARRATGAGLEERALNAPFAGLMVIDGTISNMAAMNALSPSEIVSVNVLKGAAATAKYPNRRAVNGVIEVTTNAKR
jgi:beta-lactamase regulating signal transducer with metallopeptidase domain